MKHEQPGGSRGEPMSGPLVDAAGLVADGSDFDLLSLSSSLASDEDRAIADELAVVARIAQAHRKLHQVLPAPEAGSDRVPFASSWGHLDLIEVVGRGSYGTVYRAWDPRLDRQVALKLFHGARNPEAVMREGRMLARIRNENVVTVYGADVYNGIAGIWMEFVHGRRLDQIVEQQGPLSVEEATRVGLAVCRALAAVHGAGLLHCDVKAQNVIREHEGRIVLMDLGAGRSTIDEEDVTSKLQVAGTPRYMAPEVFDRGSALPQSDVYSVGVLLFYLVTGRFPVDGRTLADIRRGHLEARRTPLVEIRADLPDAFVKTVARAIEPAPGARHATPGELEADLTGISRVDSDPLLPARLRSSSAKVVAGTGIFVASLVAVLGWTFLRDRGAAVPADGRRPLAVLPIKNLTGDAAKAYLVDGLTEVLISNLARVRALRVPSFGAVAAFRDSSERPSGMAKQLGVELLLSSSLVEVDGQIRMIVQLVDGRSDDVVWSEEFRPDRTQLLAVQADVARSVASRLELDLTAPEVANLKQPAVDPRAQDEFLRGLVDASSKLDTAIPEAAQHFRTATTVQPDFADAWGHWAMIELRMAQFVGDQRRSEHVATARNMASRALAINAQSPVALVALGTAQFYYDWDLRAAEDSFRAALEVEPSNVNAQQSLSGLLAALNRTKEAVALAQESVRLEPAVPARLVHLGMMYYYARDYDRALQQMEQALRIAPGFPLAYSGASRVFAARGLYQEAADYLERAIATGRNMAWVSELACFYAAAGRAADVQRVQLELEERARRGEYAPIEHAAHIAAVRGRIEDGFNALTQSVANREPDSLWLLVDPRLDAYRQDPRYIQLLKQAGLQ